MRSCRRRRKRRHHRRPRLKAGRPIRRAPHGVRLDRDRLPASRSVGRGWRSSPELQLIGQRLDFAPFTDADEIAADLGSQSQGVIRAGARLLKPFATTDSGVFTAYLKANLLSGPGRRRDRQSRRLSVPDRNFWDRSAGRRGRQRRPIPQPLGLWRRRLAEQRLDRRLPRLGVQRGRPVRVLS